ncbi:Golgi apparatus membrane protein TVP38 [Collybia nuda]|uniref:Golgi apparatus membrane protein TVP38 n=1 Tax=Collybia nuda TaxID=64659 RepID=A0A9P6CQK0_9AGAR|nr:Golgi apparatus membrane protein TVP38 [Collybia nuda]
MTAKVIGSSVPIIKKYAVFLHRRYKALHVFGKLFIWLVVLFYICTAAFIIIVKPSRIAQYLYDRARMLAETRYGWLALAGAIVLISFPPLVGHTTLVSLCGFAYGMKGFYIASSASIVGSAIVFVVLRFLLSHRLHQWSTQNVKWQALEAVVKAKGLPLIILIRICPFPPWVYSNSLFASIEAVKLWQFVAATFFVSPKLALHVFIGSKIAALSDGDQRSHMDNRTKVINGLLIVGGIIVAIFTSWLVYTLVQSHIKKLEGIPPEVDELAAEAIEDFGEEEPLLRSNSPESVNGA